MLLARMDAGLFTLQQVGLEGGNMRAWLLHLAQQGPSASGGMAMARSKQQLEASQWDAAGFGQGQEPALWW